MKENTGEGSIYISNEDSKQAMKTVKKQDSKQARKKTNKKGIKQTSMEESLTIKEESK